ncbi:hypothetical protein KDI_45790 [Dictyobacter arantiisoli]|uniref:Uncharacterized protein n=1 Tax=Dictyobacter arantiisoli TaxID=2014874 RepID=A0A5A5TIG7_9CHLR|nr:hypothetical protein KDI_45790 [Dictyobacter arantiisoli]
MGTPQTPAKGWPPFAIPLVQPYVRTYGLPPLHPAFTRKDGEPADMQSVQLSE